MAAYIGDVQGSRGSASRLGGAAGGIESRLAGWTQGIRTHIHDKDGVPWLHIELVRHSGQGRSGIIYSGPIADAPIIGG